MAKRQRTNRVTGSFHYVMKRRRNEPEAEPEGFTSAEFNKIVARIENTRELDFDDDKEVMRVKRGENLPFLYHEQISENTHYGVFEGAYYGQEYRNTKVGVIDAESLNLRQFHYIIDHRRDGKIVVGTQYIGNFGDYDGLSKCFANILRSNESVVTWRSFTSLRHEIGSGTPVELKVNIRKQNPKTGGAGLFSRSGVFAIKGSEYGATFAQDIKDGLAPAARGKADSRKSAIAKLMSSGDLMDVNDDDIAGCTLLMMNDGYTQTIHIIGDNHFATKFPLSVDVPSNGILERKSVRDELKRVLDDVITPGLRQ